MSLFSLAAIRLIALLSATCLYVDAWATQVAPKSAEVAKQEAVVFPAETIVVKGLLFKPGGAGPFPSVIALHGCSGLYDVNGALSARHADWAKRLSESGFLVLFPDSFGSRGAGSQCKTDDRVTRPGRERVADVLAAKTYLQSRGDVKANALSLLGWSNGGSTVLYAVSTRQKLADQAPDFAKAIAFYPGCRLPAKEDWHGRVPLLILIGAEDDWTPAQPCKELIDRAHLSGDPASIVTYAGAYHDFDHPNLALHLTTELAYTADGQGTAHTGTNPVARADAITRVLEFLAR